MKKNDLLSWWKDVDEISMVGKVRIGSKVKNMIPMLRMWKGLGGLNSNIYFMFIY